MMENQVENIETTQEELENTTPVEEVTEVVEDKFIVLPEKLVQDMMTYLGTRPANEVVNFINGVSSTAQYATMQPAPEAEAAPETEK